MRSSDLLSLASHAGLVAAHGLVVGSARVRSVGPATIAACGKAVTDEILSDNTSHIEGLPELAATDPSFNPAKCNVFLCKGIQFEDNKDNVQMLKPGQVVHFDVDITIPHNGDANMSIVDTKTNKIIGNMVAEWPKNFADEAQFASHAIPLNQTSFNITMPDVSAGCSQPAACVIQWWWHGTAAKQSYENCMDFVMTASADTGTGKGAGASSATDIPAGNAAVAAGQVPTAATGGSAGMSMTAAGAAGTMPQTADPATGKGVGSAAMPSGPTGEATGEGSCSGTGQVAGQVAGQGTGTPAAEPQTTPPTGGTTTPATGAVTAGAPAAPAAAMPGGQTQNHGGKKGKGNKGSGTTGTTTPQANQPGTAQTAGTMPEANMPVTGGTTGTENAPITAPAAATTGEQNPNQGGKKGDKGTGTTGTTPQANQPATAQGVGAMPAANAYGAASTELAPVTATDVIAALAAELEQDVQEAKAKASGKTGKRQSFADRRM